MILPKEELNDVLHKVQKTLEHIDIHSVPPLSYNLMLLAQESNPGFALQIIIEYFNKQEINSSEKRTSSNDDDSISTVIEDDNLNNTKFCNLNDLREAQGTVVLHLTHLTQYNPDLVKDYLKIMKQLTWIPKHLITPFNLSLLFSLASIDRYEDQILDCLKSCLLKYYKQEEKMKHSSWLRDTLSEYLNIASLFKMTIKSNASGSQVNFGLIQLAFSLLECGNGIRETYFSQCAIKLAYIILPLILKQESNLVGPILQQLSNLILTSSNPKQYIDLLGKLSKQCPMILLQHLNLIREIIEQLGFMEFTSASTLLNSIQPLIKINMTLKDALVLILRKLLFSREVKNRKIAVHGILLFLRNFKLMGTLPCSQSSMSFSSA